MTLLSVYTPADIQGELADSIRRMRKQRKLSRKALAEISTVPAPTLKKFETTGQISLRQFLLLWQALSDLKAIHDLAKFAGIDDQGVDSPRTINDVLKG